MPFKGSTQSTELNPQTWGDGTVFSAVGNNLDITASVRSNLVLGVGTVEFLRATKMGAFTVGKAAKDLRVPVPEGK